MAKTINDLQTLLSNHGYACEQMLDLILATRVPTKTYKDPTGESVLQILLTFDRPNDCVAVEVLRAFDLRTTEHREATLACLMAASFRTALLRPSLDPADGEIRLRIDCPCGEEGARDMDVLRAMALIPSFVEAWYPQVVSAMESGEFEPNDVPRLNLTRTLRTPPSAAPPAADTPAAAAPADDTPADEKGERSVTNPSPTGELVRAASMSQKPGAHPNRLRALFEFHRRHGRGGDNPADRN
jgi:hypothetical protein